VFVCCLFDLSRCVRELLFCEVRRGGAKIAWPRPRNTPSQILCENPRSIKNLLCGKILEPNSRVLLYIHGQHGVRTMKEEQRQRFVAQLEKLGVGEVKQRLVTGSYAGPWKNIAQGWVERKEAGSSAEQLSLARQANRLAIAALVIAAVSMVIAAFSLDVSGAFK
jgi:hypothetical protein